MKYWPGSDSLHVCPFRVSHVQPYVGWRSPNMPASLIARIINISYQLSHEGVTHIKAGNIWYCAP